VRDGFIDIGGIVDHDYYNFLFVVVISKLTACTLIWWILFLKVG